ncbi:MAG TPA: hypothetical protein VLX68_11050 [Chitinivibrionales bacterium]|nr:hypothetical protein [Chitinivibrionales bacterium]
MILRKSAGNFPALPILIGALLLCLCQSKKQQTEAAYRELAFVKQSVERQINSQEDCLAQQIAAFAAVVAGDREFSMKLLVEKDKSAPEVTEIAQRYLAPMGLSILSITDSQYVILSCGHFPANAGSMFTSGSLLGDKPAFVMDNVKGETVLTLQSKSPFKILNAVFYVCGGMAVGKDFLARLSCWPGYSILVKQGTTVLGMEKVESISDVKDSTILLNNVRYPAASIGLPYAGAGDAPVCIVMSNRPCQ